MAIERYAIMAADLAAGAGAVNIYDAHYRETTTIDVSAPVTKGEPKWSNYIRGVLAGFQNRGDTIPALDVAFMSTVPMGGGLSSSAALEVCTATLMEAATGQTIDPVEKALIAQTAEHEFAGVPCGIMDQFISALGREGHLLLLDCRTRKTQLVPMNDLSVELLVINTNVKHELGNGEYALRRAQCEEATRVLGVPSLRDATPDQLEHARQKLSDVVYRRARHVIGEIERTLHAAEGIRQSNWPTVGQFMYASHYSLRDDYEVSCRELDAVVEIAEEIGIAGGVYGCRMTGGGFGGCCVALVKASSVGSISQKIAHPAAGATILKGQNVLPRIPDETGVLALSSAEA
jgi:galactokinase